MGHNSNFVGYVFGWGGAQTHSAVLDTNQHKITIANGTFTLDDVLLWTSPYSLNQTRNIQLFAWERNNTIPGEKAHLRVYSFVIAPVSAPNSPVMSLIPCYRKSDSKPGMYDLITNTFFTNAGTDEFTIGNNV